MNVCSSDLVSVSTFCCVVFVFVFTLFTVISSVGYVGLVCFVPIICFRCFHVSLMFSVSSSLLHLSCQFFLFSILISLFISLLCWLYCVL